MLVYACTSNSGKLREFLHAAAQGIEGSIHIEALPGLKGITPPEETGSTFEENAALKAIYYSQFSKQPVFADDSGLEIDSLEGRPGVRSARYAGADATDQKNSERVLRELEPFEKRQARFVTAISLAVSGTVLHTSRGTVEGRILREPKGSNGFGYDPLFFSDALGKTFAEATDGEKLQVSARGNAVRGLLQWILKNQDVVAGASSGRR